MSGSKPMVFVGYYAAANTCCWALVALLLDGVDLLLDEFQSLDLAFDLLSKSWREGPSLSGHELVDLERLVARLHVDAANALGKQQSLDAVDVRRPLGN